MKNGKEWRGHHYTIVLIEFFIRKIFNRTIKLVVLKNTEEIMYPHNTSLKDAKIISSLCKKADWVDLKSNDKIVDWSVPGGFQ